MKVHHWYQRHQRQILPPVPLVLLIPVANFLHCPFEVLRLPVCRRIYMADTKILFEVGLGFVDFISMRISILKKRLNQTADLENT